VATPSTSTRTRAVKKPTDRPRKKAAPVEDIPMPEVEVLDLDAEEVEDYKPDLVEIFRLNGKSHYIDRNIGAGVALRMLKTLRTEGEDAAVGAMLTELLSEESFDALANHRGIRPKHLAQILLACQKAILGDDKTGPKA
jgi:hypothetical protein